MRTAPTYAGRLEAIIAALDSEAAAQEQLGQNLVYHEFPRLHVDDGDKLAAMRADADVVVFDSQRMFLTDLGLAEDKSDDYARFVGIAIDPLFRAGTATVILDNTGHQEPKRSRGTSSKGDLNEIIFTLEAVYPFDLTTIGRARLEASDSRFGNTGRWEMTIGAGRFEPWQSTGKDETATSSDFRPTVLMERVSRYLELQHEPVSQTAVERTVIGNGKYLRTAIDRLVREGHATEQEGPRTPAPCCKTGIPSGRPRPDPVHVQRPRPRPDPVRRRIAQPSGFADPVQPRPDPVLDRGL